MIQTQVLGGCGVREKSGLESGFAFNRALQLTLDFIARVLHGSLLWSKGSLLPLFKSCHTVRESKQAKRFGLILPLESKCQISINNLQEFLQLVIS